MDAFGSFQQIGWWIAAAAHVAGAVWVLRSGRARVATSARRAVVAALAVSVVWCIFSAFDVASSRRWTVYAAFTADAGRYALWCTVAAALIGPLRASSAAAGAPSTWSWPMRAIAAVAVATALVGLVAGVRPPAPSETAMLAWCQMAWAVLTLLLVEQLLRNRDDQQRWGVKSLGIALAVMAAFDVYLFSQVLMLGVLDVDAQRARAFVHVVAVPLVALAVRRKAVAPSTLQVSRAAVFYSASLLLVGAYLILVAAAGFYVRYAGGRWGAALQLALAFAALCVLGMVLLSGAARSRLRVFIGKHFMRYRYDYRVEWLRFTELMSRDGAGPQDVGDRVVRGLADLIESNGGTLWLKVSGEPAFVESARWSMPSVDAREPVDGPFGRVLDERDWIFDLRSQTPHDGANDAVPAWLREIPGAWLVVPLAVAQQGVVGFVVLRESRAAVDLNWEVLDLLKTAARQAAAFLSQLQATEALLEARKFDAFNRMSAFVVHDLKNIVTQLSLLLKNAQRHRDNPEFQDDMLETVENSLDKMRQMMLQLREGARPTGGTAGVELRPIAERIRASWRQRGREVEVDVEDHAATRGHVDRLERVLGHLVHNAVDATPATGRIWLHARNTGGRLRVDVGDTGAGMTREFVETRLFRPFHTTKTTGMGIGTYESFQYVKELGGSVEVDSEPGRGTVVTVWLPVFELGTRTVLDVARAA